MEQVDFYMKHFMTVPLETLKYYIENVRFELLSFECRRFNLKLPYTCYLQLTVQTGKERKIQRFPYSMKLYEATKHLNDVLFKGRRWPILVEKFQLPYSSWILRVPAGFKVCTKQLRNSVCWTNRYDVIASLLDPSMFLDVVQIETRDEDDFLFPLVRDAKKLIICSPSPALEILPSLTALSNKEVILGYTGSEIPAEEYFGLVQEWLTGDKPIGTCDSFGIEKEEQAKELLKVIKNRVENVKKTKRCVSIRTKNHSRLEVFYIPIKDSQKSKQEGMMYDRKWVLKIRIVHL